MKKKLKRVDLMPASDPFEVSERTRQLLNMALEEDIGDGDLTSNTLIPPDTCAKAYVLAKEGGVFCGAPVLRELFLAADSTLDLRFLIPEGKTFRKNASVLEIGGCLRSILKAERTAINLLGHLSGIATKTHKFIQSVKSYPVIVLDTRKTTPLWREIEKYAVRVGGGKNHRMGLFDAILVKENHRPYAEFKNLQPHIGRFEIEVRNLKELREALEMRPGIILLDNFAPALIKRAVHIARQQNPEVILEASGGITFENLVHYAAMGVDWISIGSLTRSVRSIDFSLLVE